MKLFDEEEEKKPKIKNEILIRIMEILAEKDGSLIMKTASKVGKLMDKLNEDFFGNYEKVSSFSDEKLERISNLIDQFDKLWEDAMNE